MTVVGLDCEKEQCEREKLREEESAQFIVPELKVEKCSLESSVEASVRGGVYWWYIIPLSYWIKVAKSGCCFREKKAGIDVAGIVPFSLSERHPLNVSRHTHSAKASPLSLSLVSEGGEGRETVRENCQ